MPRTARMVIPNEQAVYHVIFPHSLERFSYGRCGKRFFVEIDQTLLKTLFYVNSGILPDGKPFSPAGKDYKLSEGRLPYVRTKLGNLSEFIRDIKVNFTRFYNRRHNRRGH